MSTLARGTVSTEAPSDAALQLLGRYGGALGSRALAAAAAWQLAAPAVRWARQRRRARDYTISVGGTDDIYPDLHEWLLARIPAEHRRAMLLDTYRPNRYELGENGDGDRPQIKLRYDGTRVQQVRLDGHKIEVSVMREELPGGRENLAENWRRYLEKIQFSCPSIAARDAVVRMIDELAGAKYGGDERSPLMMPSRWGGDWQHRSDLRARTIDSVVLKAGQTDRLVRDLGRFIDREEEYVRLCQPWHRGYLFHGTPGTGKTSAARALAHHFNLPVYYLPLGDLERDANLMNLVQAIKPRSMLLLEDADVYHAVTDRQDEAGRVSLASMLNALDGVWTPHGLVTVLTTNKLENLDEALIRAGRVDVREEFTPLDGQQLAALCSYAGNGDGFPAQEYLGRSPAELMEAVRAAGER